MSRSSSLHGITSTVGNNNNNRKFKGVRRRKWGKWVSEIRVPGTQERLWLGTYATPEAAAAAHDVAVYCLRRPSSLEKLNFPETLSSYCCVQQQQQRDLSPRSVQKIASDAGMAVDAQNIIIAGTGKKTSSSSTSTVTQTLTEETSYDQKEKSTGDGDNIQPNRNDHSDLFWWEGLGDDCTETWQASSEDSREGEALSISVEDYL